jgi:hypothetical protein
VGTVTYNDFLDDAGLVVESIDVVNVTATLTNRANGKSVTTHVSYVEHWVGEDLFGPNEVVYTVTLTGNNLNITIPGLGATAQRVGRIVFRGLEEETLFSAGPKLVSSDTAQFCAYMADP